MNNLGVKCTISSNIWPRIYFNALRYNCRTLEHLKRAGVQAQYSFVAHTSESNKIVWAE
jgi:hypothetical protein